MNKNTSIIFAAVLAAALTACSCNSIHTEGSAADNPGEGSAAYEPLCGGWQRPASPETTPELENICSKAFNNFGAGMGCYPVAYLARQTVDGGTNHLILCFTYPVVPDPVQHYAIAKIYQNQKNECQVAEISESQALNIFSSESDSPEDWHKPASPIITDKLKSIFDGAFKPPADAAYRPLVLLGVKVAGGTDYCFFCVKTSSSLPSADSCAFVYLYKDSQGHTEITDIVHFMGGAKQ